jgi:hypothetical protein
VLRQASGPRVPPVAVTDIRCPMAHSVSTDPGACRYPWCVVAVWWGYMSLDVASGRMEYAGFYSFPQAAPCSALACRPYLPRRPGEDALRVLLRRCAAYRCAGPEIG